MIPEMLKQRGAVHLADEDSRAVPALNPPRWVIELVPESVARENIVLPLALNGETLTVAAADAGNLLVADKLSFLVNKKIRLVPAPRAALVEAIRRHYGQDETDSVDSMLCEFTDADLADEPPTAGGWRGHDERREHLLRSRTLGSPMYFLKTGPAAPARYADASILRDAGPARAQATPGEDTTPDYGRDGMWFYVVEEGQRALMIRSDGRMEVIVGPRRVWQGRNRFEKMKHFVAHPGEFLVVRFRDGRQEHLTGPADLWFDPRIHETVSRQEGLQLAAKEAVIVYSRPAETGPVTRRIVTGPTLFVPAPGEWLHTFTWHGSDGGSTGVRKIAKGLVFQKLWLMPDQMYHDVTDVRTADDAVLTVRLMIFFELQDIERMLETTHDPIGDFVNAATSDVVDFVGRRTFEQFKHDTGGLNELEAYRQLIARASQTGYRIAKVVYRGYGAPDRLQAMHDQAIEARTKLQLERATEQQAQELEDYKLTAQMVRAGKRRTEQGIEVDTEIAMAAKRQEAEMRQREAERAAAREQRRRDAEAQLEIRRQADERQRQHLAALKEMGVDLTAYLTQGRADRVIELRGGNGKTHVHLDRIEGEPANGK
jgi:hypothetical protein